MIIRKYDDSQKRFFCFVLIGVLSSLAYLFVLSFCVDWLGWSVIAGAFASFVVGTCVSYIGNTIYTFGKRVTSRTMWRFFVVTLVGMGLNQTIAWGLDKLGIHYLFIAAAVFIFVPIVNFLGHSNFTYSERSV